MMINPNDPAYPTPIGHYSQGLTKREYYIAQALQGLAAYHGDTRAPVLVAREAVELADQTIIAMQGMEDAVKRGKTR